MFTVFSRSNYEIQRGSSRLTLGRRSMSAFAHPLFRWQPFALKPFDSKVQVQCCPRSLENSSIVLSLLWKDAESRSNSPVNSQTS